MRPDVTQAAGWHSYTKSAMPIYEYRCDQGHIFEVMRRMSDEPLSTCQTCDAPVEQVFHPIAVHFKGSGFYNTDYGTQKRSREQQEKNTEKAKSEAKTAADQTTAAKPSESKSAEAKPAAAKAEAKAPAPKQQSD
jgi:putative FmdB family regulatory protein